MAEYNPPISKQGFNPSMEQSKFNPPAPLNDNSNYKNKQAIANQIISISRSFGESFGLAHQREQQQEEINSIAENKIFREELIQAFHDYQTGRLGIVPALDYVPHGSNSQVDVHNK